MARRKSADFHMRIDPVLRRMFQECADELDLSLAAWMEVVCYREALERQRNRFLSTVYPQKYRRRPQERV